MLNAKEIVLILESDQRDIVMDALLIGLTAYGEIERLTDKLKKLVELGGMDLPKDIIPRHPTGSADTVGVFASALSFMQLLEPSPQETPFVELSGSTNFH